MIGTSVHHYRVTGKLGEGGMGVVWRAEDTRLGRAVALKFLPGELAHDEAALRRFEAEARLASSINHPHIVAVHDVGEHEGSRYMAMELIEGGTLRDLLGERRLKLREVIDFGLQVADALAAAHRAGVLHRDVKPDNVFVSRDGYAKLGDFGLAKLRERPGGAGATTVTQAGTVVGTPRYMSPEQAHGEELDARSDIFSFAATLYEMATGRFAFDGRSFAETASLILGQEPARATEVDPRLPRELDHILAKGLEKERQYRYQHTDEVVADLRRLKRDLESGRSAAAPAAAPAAPAASPAPRRRRRARAAGLAAVGVAVAAAATVAIVIALGGRGADGLGPVELVRLTTQPGLEDEPSWSPDGRNVAYTSDEGGHLGIWIRQVDGERAVRVSDPDVDEAQPAWSPDGTRIAFVSSRNRGGRFGIFLGSRPIEIYVLGQNGDLFVRLALGGTARKIADQAYDPSWSPDGRSIAYRSIAGGDWRIWTVNVEDGRAAPFASVGPRALGPAWSPDGRWIAYVGGASAATGWDLYVVAASGGPPVRLTADRATVALRPAWSRDGRWIIYSSDRGGSLNLWRVRFRADPPGAAGSPERLTTGVGEDVNPSESPDGASLAYATVHTAPDIWRVESETGELTQLTSETTIEDYPRLAADGRRLIFYSDRTGRDELWLMDLETGELTQLSRGGGTQNAWAPDGRTVACATPQGLRILEVASSQTVTVGSGLSTAYPAFSRDGAAVCFQGWDGERYRLYRAPAAGGEASVVPTPEGDPGNPCWSPDAAAIYYQLDQLGLRNIWAVDLATGESRQITHGNADDAHPDLSPDGRTLLFLRGHRDLYVMPAVAGAGAGEPRLVHSSGGKLIEFPAWTADGRAIVFSLAERSGDLFLMRRAASL